jgi:hypothetical protein
MQKADAAAQEMPGVVCWNICVFNRFFMFTGENNIIKKIKWFPGKFQGFRIYIR